MIKFFGTTVGETVRVFRGPHFGPADVEPGDKTKAIVRLIISLVLLYIGAYLVFANQGQSENLGVSLLSFVAGYWLK